MGFLPDWLQQLADECPEGDIKLLYELLDDEPEKESEDNSNKELDLV